jgi:hypothetical protein
MAISPDDTEESPVDRDRAPDSPDSDVPDWMSTEPLAIAFDAELILTDPLEGPRLDPLAS